jgi:hypothetical protein
VALADDVVEARRAHAGGKRRSPRQLLFDSRVEQAAGLAALAACRSSRGAHQLPTVTEQGTVVKAVRMLPRNFAPRVPFAPQVIHTVRRG